MRRPRRDPDRHPHQLGPAARATRRVDAAAHSVAHRVEAVKPRLRGWLHAGMAPVAVVLGVVLIALAPTTHARLAAIAFAVSAGLLFGTSAIYHRGRWSPAVAGVLRRLDHSNIFLIIAGTYSPFALLLPHGQAKELLIIVWSGAALGMFFRIVWVGAPRWLYTPVYVALGWVAVFYIGPLFRRGGPAIVTLIIVGGALYTLGALVYGTRRPNPSPRWFGFHEVFHALTIAAFVTHYVAASITLYGPVAAGVPG